MTALSAVTCRRLAALALAVAEAALQEYARGLKAADAAALAAMYASDGELLQPGTGPIQGPRTIHAFFDSFGDSRVEAATLGAFAERVAVPGHPLTMAPGRFVAQWLFQPSR